MKRLGAFAALALAVIATALPASAAQFIQDGAGMFSAGTIAQLDQRIGAFNAQTGKEIVVVTVPSLNGETRQQAAQTVFSEQRVNGVLIFIAKAERQDQIMVGTRTAEFFPAGTTAQIRQAMEAQFKNGDFDGGITTAVNQTLDVFRSHLNSLPSNTAPRNYPATTYQRTAVSNGVHLPVILWIVIIIVGFMIIRSIFRSMSGPRYYGGPGGPGGAPMGGPGYGPGYYGGGGGGFWSGLLGGLGGAWLGNELFGGNRGSIVEQPGTTMAPGDGGGSWGGNAPDAGGWGNDAGQSDPGASSGGDWGGGGFGGGDFGGGGGGFGGGDSGGGGGDSGGGW